MIHPTKKEYEQARNAAFLHASREYMIRCAKSVIHLAPLPEFIVAIQTLEQYDADPSEQNRQAMMRINREVFSKAQVRKRYSAYGHTVTGALYQGLRTIFRKALDGGFKIHSGYTYTLTMVYDYAPHEPWEQHAESEKHAAIQKEVFDAYNAKFGKPWKEYRATILAPEGALCATNS